MKRFHACSFAVIKWLERAIKVEEKNQRMSLFCALCLSLRYAPDAEVAYLLFFKGEKVIGYFPQ